MKFFSTQVKQCISILTALVCMLSSCVEDENNPFGNNSNSNNNSNITGNYINVMMPHNGQYYIGSEIELIGSDFSASDEIYVRNEDYTTLYQARVTSYSDEYLYFIIPDEIEPDNFIEVSIVRSGETYVLGTLYVYDIDLFESETDITIYGEIVSDDKVYYQDIVDENNGNYTLGTLKEADIIYMDDYQLQATNIYPLTETYLITYVHNGESITKETYNYYYWYNSYSCSVGEEVSIEWGGFESSDEILIENQLTFNTYSPNRVTFTSTEVTFTVPEINEIDYNTWFTIYIVRYGKHFEFGNLYIYF